MDTVDRGVAKRAETVESLPRFMDDIGPLFFVACKSTGTPGMLTLETLSRSMFPPALPAFLDWIFDFIEREVVPFAKTPARS